MNLVFKEDINNQFQIIKNYAYFSLLKSCIHLGIEMFIMDEMKMKDCIIDNKYLAIWQFSRIQQVLLQAIDKASKELNIDLLKQPFILIKNENESYGAMRNIYRLIFIFITERGVFLYDKNDISFRSMLNDYENGFNNLTINLNNLIKEGYIKYIRSINENKEFDNLFFNTFTYKLRNLKNMYSEMYDMGITAPYKRKRPMELNDKIKILYNFEEKFK